MPAGGMEVAPFAFKCSMVSPRGAHPLALSPYSLPVFASQ